MSYITDNVDNMLKNVGEEGPKRWLVAIVGTIVVLLLNFVIHAAILTFLTTTQIHGIFIAIIAIVWGTIGFFVFYMSVNFIISLYPDKWSQRLQALIFLGPALFILGWLMLLPALRTIRLSFMDRHGDNFVGLANYVHVFTDRAMLQAFQNTLLWVIVGTIGCVSLGLLIAILADRSSFEKLAKLLIFMPIAISFVGASIIWRFIYAYRPGDDQIGLLNAIVQFFGGEPRAWLTMVIPWNNFFLMVILIWMMTGFAMVMFSAALKGVPKEIIEAARVDGATEIRTFFSIIIPYIRGTIVAVTTAITIFSMRVFDAVWVMTGGQYGTDVIATVFYREYFTFNNSGTGSAIAIILLLAVVPVIIANVLNAKEEGF